MNAAKAIRQEFTWSIRTQRVCEATTRKHFNPGISDAEAIKTSKAEALKYIAEARKHCERWIKGKLDLNEITKRQASAARKALDDAEAKARQLANGLEKQQDQETGKGESER